MSDTDSLKPYRSRGYPSLAGADARYFDGEFRRIADAIGSLVIAAQSLEARIAASEAIITDHETRIVALE